MRFIVKPRRGILLARCKFTGSRSGWTSIGRDLMTPARKIHHLAVIVGAMPQGRQVPAVRGGLLLHEREDLDEPGHILVAMASGRYAFVYALETVHRQGNLFEMIRTLNAAGRFTCGLHRWQQKRHQDPDDRDDHQ